MSQPLVGRATPGGNPHGSRVRSQTSRDASGQPDRAAINRANSARPDSSRNGAARRRLARFVGVPVGWLMFDRWASPAGRLSDL
jgi:hypothetical protein